MEEKDFGRLSDGSLAKLYILKNDSMTLTVTDVGAAVYSLRVPDKNGCPVDVVAGYPDARVYEESPCFFGATIGRNANRIADAKFILNGRTYHLAKNDFGRNNLHSGPDGFERRKWEVTEKSDAEITFSLFSPDGDQGYPGNLRMTVTYRLAGNGSLEILLTGQCDEDTVFNPTNHMFFNLNGHDSGSILNHRLRIFADDFSPTDENRVAFPNPVSVAGTPFDFRQTKPIGRDMDITDKNLAPGPGYDHNFFVNRNQKLDHPEKIAELIGDRSGIQMDLYAPLPGLQFYAGCQLNRQEGKEGAVYPTYGALCLEPQYQPDSIHNPSAFSPVLRKGEIASLLFRYHFH